ncbi:MAG TPA: PQQ-binding-like beta-propeller repeat protein [Anaerolineales bacterium]|jgi:outer membrane protein assembly factor BamB
MKFNRVFFFVLVASLAVLLTACGAAPATNWPGLAADGTHAYLADGQYVYNLQLSDGSEVTTQTADGPVPARFPLKAEGTKSFYAPPALSADGQLLIGSAAASEHTFYSVDPLTSAIKWKWSYPELKNPWLAGALVLNDVVYAPSGDGNLYAFGVNGQKLWEFRASEHGLWTKPASDGKLIYVVSLDHVVFAIGTDGKKVWSQKLDNGIVGSPGILDGTLYVGTLSGNLYALDSATGNQKWVKMLDGGIWGTPVSDGTNVYVGTVLNKAGKFFALNASTGQVAWSKDDEGSITAGPLVNADQIIYVTEAGKIQALDKNGSPKWQSIIENAKLYTPPVLAGDLILIAPMNAKFLLAAYDLNGAQKWTFTAK